MGIKRWLRKHACLKCLKKPRNQDDEPPYGQDKVEAPRGQDNDMELLSPPPSTGSTVEKNKLLKHACSDSHNMATTFQNMETQRPKSVEQCTV